MKKIWIIIPAVLLMIFLIPFGLQMQRAYAMEPETEKTVEAVPEQRDLCLFMYSDIHYDPQNEVEILDIMMEQMKQLKERIQPDAMWNLGDMINGRITGREEAIRQIQTVITAEKKVGLELHHVIGNHDINYESFVNYGEELLDHKTLGELLKGENEKHHAARNTDYYVDFEKAGIRVAVITAEWTTFSESTAEWLRQEALRTDLDVLVLSHCPTRPEWGFQMDIVNGELIEAELKRFVDDGGTVIALIHGHDHGDIVNRAEDISWPEIGIGCAKYSVPTIQGTGGMTYQAREKTDETLLLFDVVSIDREKREITLVRFGAGEDRVAGY